MKKTTKEFKVLDPKEDYESCDDCKYADLPAAVCKMMDCVHAFVNLRDCFEKENKIENIKAEINKLQTYKLYPGDTKKVDLLEIMDIIDKNFRGSGNGEE